MSEKDIQRIFKHECDRHNLNVKLFNFDVSLYALLKYPSNELIERIAELTIENYILTKENEQLKREG